MNDAQDVNDFTGDSKYVAVVAVDQVPIASSEHFVFGNERTSFGKALQSLNLFFETANKLFCFFGTVLRDKRPRFFDVALRCAGDPNAKFCGHV